MAEGVEGVRTQYFLWLEARMAGTKDFDPKKADTERTRSVLPGHPKCVVGGVKGVRGLMTTCKWG